MKKLICPHCGKKTTFTETEIYSEERTTTYLGVDHEGKVVTSESVGNGETTQQSITCDLCGEEVESITDFLTLNKVQ